MSESKGAAWRFGYEYCRLGRPCETAVSLTSYERSEFEAGYAARYEEEQQLTNQCEEQENGN